MKLLQFNGELGKPLTDIFLNISFVPLNCNYPNCYLNIGGNIQKILELVMDHQMNRPNILVMSSNDRFNSVVCIDHFQSH